MKKQKPQSCKKCGGSIIWAENERGKNIPLSITQEVYSIVYPGPHDKFFTKRAKQQVYVNHQLICGAKWQEFMFGKQSEF